ncbi:protein YgfX [Congregibacter sp.]|uniref:protein YgfX n=1 Tax=Congregibacter sp. TaxID=2744308 RepID=UPI003F6CCB80
MPGDLRIHLHSSNRLRKLHSAALLLSLLCLATSLYLRDPRLLLPMLACVLLAAAISELDPRGTTLRCNGISQSPGEWLCRTPEQTAYTPCIIRDRGRLTDLQWLDCVTGAVAGRRGQLRRLLVFSDAMSYEHWRLLRRQLRLDAHGREAAVSKLSSQSPR